MLLSALNTLSYLDCRFDDDLIDRCHYFLTSNLLLALCLIASFKQFGNSPIECMVPDIFTGSWEQYAENYCWAQDTYFLPFSEIVPGDPAQRTKTKISYYQWVPFFLLFEAACFRLPSLAWKYLAGHSGIKVHDIVKVATDPKTVQADGRLESLKSLTIHLQNALKFHRRAHKKKIRPHTYLRPLNLPYSAGFVTFVYLMVKCLYLLNVVLQMYFMNKFLGTDHYSFFGFGVMKDMFDGATWETSGLFPRVTLCDFKVRMMGSNVQRYSVQCVLVINIFNEKIFLFLWFWYTVLGLLTSLSILYWTCVMCFSNFHVWFVSRHLELSEMPFDPKGSQRDVQRFISGYLKTDGIFILRMITMHAGIIYGTDLILQLWKAFYGIEEARRRSTLPMVQFANSPGEKANLLGIPPGFTGGKTDGGGGSSAEESPTSKSSHKSRFSFMNLRKRRKRSIDQSDADGKVDADRALNALSDQDAAAKRLIEVLIPDGKGGTQRAYVVRQLSEPIADDNEEDNERNSDSVDKEENERKLSIILPPPEINRLPHNPAFPISILSRRAFSQPEERRLGLETGRSTDHEDSDEEQNRHSSRGFGDTSGGSFFNRQSTENSNNNNDDDDEGSRLLSLYTNV